jgi:hypothetical protein
MTKDLPTTPPSRRVEEFLHKVRTARRGRVIFLVDATGSRQSAWDMASRTQAQMFSQAAAFGTLDLQLVYFRGTTGVDSECKASRWTSDGTEMARLMAKITCRTGGTQILKALQHVRDEHQRQPINAVIYVGDMVDGEEDTEAALCDLVGGLGVPCFLFQEGNDPHAAPIFREMARLSRGAHFRFRPGAERELADALRAVAAFATGGLTALQNLKSDAAVKLLGQMK